jgi:hypothetical protein
VQARQNFNVAARLFFGQQRDCLPDAIFVQQIILLATAEQLPGVALCLFGNFHCKINAKAQRREDAKLKLFSDSLRL